MLIGVWKNIEELEESIGLEELKVIVNASREKEERANRFLAAVNGIDLNEGNSSAQDKFDEIQSRVAAKLAGVNQEVMELNELGMDVETEE